SALPPPTDNLDDVSDIVADGIARVLAPGERINLVGFSFGGHMSGRIAARLGDRVRSLILVGAGGFGLPRGRRTELTKAPSGLTPAETYALQRDNLGRLMFEHRDNIDDVAVWMQVRHIALGRFKSVKFAPGTWLAKSLPLVTARLGGIWGEYDITAHPYVDQRDAYLRSLQPEALFHVVRNIGHWVQYEGADEFNRVLLDWLAGMR
ncbi:MAG: alpha/beta fold hydrolase, partial [Stellaceae bacterium]